MSWKLSVELIGTTLTTLQEIEAAGTMKRECAQHSPQSSWVPTPGTIGDRQLLNLCANNDLGLTNDPRLIGAAKQALDPHGFGVASARFICGTQDLHRRWKRRPQRTSAWKTTSPFRAVLTPTAESSNRCSMSATRSSQMRSTMHPSWTVFASARHSVCATQTTTWTTSSNSCKRHRTAAFAEVGKTFELI